MTDTVTLDRTTAAPRSRRSAVKDRLLMIAWGAPMGLWLGVFFASPLVLLVVMSFWSMENYQLSATYTLQNWQDFFSFRYYRAGYVTTVAYAATATAVGLVCAFPVAYTISFRLGPKARLAAVLLLVAPFFSSYLVRSYAWRVVLANNGIVNYLLTSLGLPPIAVLDQPVATILGYLTYTFPIITLILVVSLGAIDRSLVEASHNLGGARFATLFRVVLPSARTGLAFAGTFSFILSFGDFIAPSLLGGGNPPTLSILIIDTVKSASNWPGAAVIAVVMIMTLIAVTMLGLTLARVGRERAMTRRRRSPADIAVDIGLALATIAAFGFVFVPIIVLIVFSFNVDRYPSIPWTGTSLVWYRELLDDPTTLEAAWNSLRVGVSVSILATTLGATAAYFSSRWRFRGKVLYTLLTASPPTVPLLILGLSILIFLNQFGMSGNIRAVIIGQTVLCSPFAMGLVTLRLSTMDRSLEEVSWNLGGGEWYTFRKVVLPQLVPALCVSLILTLALSLDEFIITWFVSGLETTLPVEIYTKIGGSVTPEVNAIGAIVFAASQILVAIAAVVWLRTTPSPQSGDTR